METALSQFANFAKSKSPVAFNVNPTNKHDEPSSFGVFCHAEHQLYKVIDTGDYMSDACQIADMLIRKQQRLDAEEFAEWIEQEFPEEHCTPHPDQIASYFA